MKKLFLILIIVLSASVCFGANTMTNVPYLTTATVDTAPGASGFTTAVITAKGKPFLSFSVTGETGTVTLQFSDDGGVTWQDEGEYEAGAAKRIDDQSYYRQWRGICKQGDFGDTGDLIFSIGW